MSSPAPGPQAVDLLRRVRAWNVPSWRRGDRVVQTRVGLDRLAAVASAHDGIPRPAIPEAGVHALADQLQVLLDDARASGASEGELAEILTDLAAGLRLRHL